MGTPLSQLFLTQGLTQRHPDYPFDQAAVGKSEEDSVAFETIDHLPAPSSISRENVSLEWEGGKPEQFSIEVKRRKSLDNYGVHNDLMNSWRSSNVYEVTNRGEGVIRKLKIKEELLDETGAVLASNANLVTFSSEAYMAPDETRLELFFANPMKKASSIRLSVIEIE